jgi:signal transduction histidine kinase
VTQAPPALRALLRYGRPVPGGRRIFGMGGDLGQPRTAPAGSAEYVTGRMRWIVLAAFAAITAAGALAAKPSAPVAAVAGLVAVGAAVLLVLRWRPLLLYAAIATASVAVLTDGRSANVGWIAVCLLGAWCTLAGNRLEALAYWAAAMILFTVEWLLFADQGWAAWLAGITLTVAFSLLIRHERDLLRQLREAQAGLAEHAKAQERNRIARELHDVIGHTLTVSLLHVQGARLAVEHDPADAARALAEAERLSRECLTEVRATVGMLRQDGAPGISAPLPGACDVPALAEQFRAAGADVTLTVAGDAGRLPAATGLAVYRILQEALTNAVKHAAGAPAVVRLAVDADAVQLVVDSAAEPGNGTGIGVVSMRERAESLGGTCYAGPGGRGWLVQATLPLDAARREAAP